MGEHDVVGYSYIEGVGDDLVEALILAIVTLTPLAVYLIYWYQHYQSLQQTIHADSQSDIADVRQHISRQNAAASNGVAPRPRRNDRDYICPVCISDSRFPVETNCGHIFCGQCVITYWEIRNRLSAVRCPSCRQQVTILFPSFSPAENLETSAEKQQLMDNINLYNRRFSGQPLSWMEYIMDLPTLLRHCISEVMSLNGLVWMFRLRVLLCFLFALLYLISPLDILPEAVFGFFGLLDDIFVMLMMAIYVSFIYRQLVATRAEQAGVPGT